MRRLQRVRALVLVGAAVAVGSGATGVAAATVVTFTPGTGFGVTGGATLGNTTASNRVTGSGRLTGSWDGSRAYAQVFWSGLIVTLPAGTTSATVELNLSYDQKLTGAATSFAEIGAGQAAPCNIFAPTRSRLTGRARTVTLSVQITGTDLSAGPLEISASVWATTPTEPPPLGRQAQFDSTFQLNSITVSTP